ncbi:peptidoglycan DD-metalloendopeptidase family protein [Mycolicibacterium vanbaalenii]|nr:peptidoglycan DD-metalloendopeptidase family protein [Mycolicibacterium vanbaalenii]
MHRGIDFEAADGTPIYAAGSGIVAHIGPAQGFGQWIVIRHDSGESTVYGHMWDAHALGLRQGDRVFAGQHIAFVGSNGQSSGPHLHFEVHPGAWRAGSQIDPRPWLNGAMDPRTRGGTVSGWTGDPVWLADVLKADGEIDVRELGGWRDRGHGDFKDIRGIMVHHTGGPASAESIRDGRPDLRGPLSQLHISRDGVVSVVAAGVSWHAGTGSLPWIPANMGNWHLIGIECEWPYRGGIGEHNQRDEPWRRPQILAIRNTCAAILRKLAFGADRITTHKEYAGRSQGKWDPGNMDPNWLRDEIAKDLRGVKFPGEGTPDYTPPPTPVPVPPVDQYAGVLLYRGMRGPAVVKLQQRLKDTIVSKLVVDGDFGPKTEAAVRAFQSSKWRRPPLVADGVVGPATAAQLGLVL